MHGTTISQSLYFSALLQTGPRTWRLNMLVDVGLSYMKMDSDSGSSPKSEM